MIEGVRRNRSQLVGHVLSMDGGIYNQVRRIAPDAVVKLSVGPSEAYTMQLVRDNTSIPVPTIRRVLPERRPPGGSYWIIMDYIDGNTLFKLWGALTDERKRSIIDALARYVRELQGVCLPNPPVPGPLHPDGVPVKTTRPSLARTTQDLSVRIRRWLTSSTASAPASGSTTTGTSEE